MVKKVNTTGQTHYAIMQRKNIKKENKAKVCHTCEDNDSGYCGKYKSWCNTVNYKCNDELTD